MTLTSPALPAQISPEREKHTNLRQYNKRKRKCGIRFSYHKRHRPNQRKQPTTSAQPENTPTLPAHNDVQECTYDDIAVNEVNETLFEGKKTLRLVIAYYYRTVMFAPPESEWDGMDGTIQKIKNTLVLKGKNVTRFVALVLTNVGRCIHKGIQYTGEYYFDGNCGQPSKIENRSADQAIIADYLEGGFGTRYTTLMVNTHRVDEGKDTIGRSSVMNAAKKMNPVVTKIAKRNQGNTAHEKWEQARFFQTLQMMI